MAYVDGFVIPVPPGKKEAYRAMAARVADAFLELGALEIMEAWEDDVPAGRVTDFRRAVKAQEGESIVFSWVVWPSREARDAGNTKLMNDPRLKSDDVPFNPQRMIHGGFRPIFTTRESDRGDPA
ncbi:DUF1428 domain-containing protein [Sphingosinicella sp. LHD-64]|uniref:DUF1428 domain-containing protein n=1 Tax=Sphingosinicella sp. LHD-64 TaxID=3072139 RepID=UPI00280CA13F|nr:DUF1428 domain-containing protein [Sphingosinicella sp. LHD-64]MDQ8756832.1 DUF1428 domain-containing protein [Sphingosinicella sp. LHD-64]